jgi:hypothetical protein
MGAMKNAKNIFDRTPDRKKSIGRPRCTWQNSIKKDLKNIVTDVYWINLA